MSYDIYLVGGDGSVIRFDRPHHLRGGTYQVGGTTEAHLNITYNYAPHFYRLFGQDGIRWLYGKTVEQTSARLEAAIESLSCLDFDSDYWKPTEGNARAALIDLLGLARMAPTNAVWAGD